MFGDEMILNREIEDWPQCDALLSWHSEGFPLKKVSPIPMCQILAPMSRRPRSENERHSAQLPIQKTSDMQRCTKCMRVQG